MAESSSDALLEAPDFLACPACHGALTSIGEDLRCEQCSAIYHRDQGVPVLLPAGAEVPDLEHVQELYDHVADEYDHVFPSHVVGHYLEKRLRLIHSVALSGRVLDVGCGTGTLAARVAESGYEVNGVDLSPGMLAQAARRGLTGVFAASATALPFADGTFDLALSVATLHHLETRVRVARTISEMARVVRRGGHVLLWDHNPLNPYWPILMRRVPQDSGLERLVPLREILAGTRAAGLRTVSVRRLGLIPDFIPLSLMPIARRAEAIVESTPGLRVFAAHNVVVAGKP
ncbi:MAG: methyltransferase domain-containing protein [Chloroflexi bacterium]|nr:methyltransferase domain-containing protein [Chloroflexota bacterium]